MDKNKNNIIQIPNEFLGTEVFGQRTRASGLSVERLPSLTKQNAEETRYLYENIITPIDLYILFHISEHRHLTINQLVALIGTISKTITKQNPNSNTLLTTIKPFRRTTEPLNHYLQQLFNKTKPTYKFKRGSTDNAKQLALEFQENDLIGPPDNTILCSLPKRQQPALPDSVTLDDIYESIQRLIQHELLYPAMPSYQLMREAKLVTGRGNNTTPVKQGDIDKSINIDDISVINGNNTKDLPALFNTLHLYLTGKGSRFLLSISGITDGKKGISNKIKRNKHQVGFVPSYKNAAFSSIVHETECTEVFTSIIMNTIYLSNQYSNEYGKILVSRCNHEMHTEINVKWRGPNTDNRGNIKTDTMSDYIKFKPDGDITLYTTRNQTFHHFYLEYDSGTSGKGSIYHKIEAYIKFILQLQSSIKDNPHRKFYMLLVSQQPRVFLRGKYKGAGLSGTYLTPIENLLKGELKFKINDIQKYVNILVAPAENIRTRGALGDSWHELLLSNDGVISSQNVIPLYELITK